MVFIDLVGFVLSFRGLGNELGDVRSKKALFFLGFDLIGLLSLYAWENDVGLF